MAVDDAPVGDAVAEQCGTTFDELFDQSIDFGQRIRGNHGSRVPLQLGEIVTPTAGDRRHRRCAVDVLRPFGTGVKLSDRFGDRRQMLDHGFATDDDRGQSA